MRIANIASMPCGVLALALSMRAVASPTAQQIIPSAAPVGARIIVVGSGLDAPDISVTFPSASGGLPMSIVSRSAMLVEGSVPRGAASGSVLVTSGGGTIGSFSFTVAPDPVFTTVATLAGGPTNNTDAIKGPWAPVVMLPNGVVYTADSIHHQVRAVAPDGTATVLAGSGKPGMTDGPAASAQFNTPTGLAFDAVRQAFYVADQQNNRIRKVMLDGTVSTLAGSSAGDKDGTGTAALFRTPTGVSVDPNGTVYIADTGNHQIRAVGPTGVVTTIAGTGKSGFADGSALSATFKAPQGVTAVSGGLVYVADTQNDSIRVITNGIVSTIAGDGHGGYVDGIGSGVEFNTPTAVAVDDEGNLLVTDYLNSVLRMINLRTSPVATSTLAGGSGAGFSDGPIGTAKFKQPAGLTLQGALYVADTFNNALRVVYSTPGLTALYQAGGPTSGGNQIRVLGTGFVPGASTLRFGTSTATVTYVTSSELLATVPAATAAGPVDVAITTPGGSASLTGAYTYYDPPRIASITPSGGKTAGGDAVIVRGTNFVLNQTTLFIGTTPASATVVTGSTRIDTITPGGAPGTVDVTVVTPGGQVTATGAFTYYDPPAIGNITPSAGSITGGNGIVVLGTNFVAGQTTITIGGTHATNVVLTGTTRIDANTPSGVTGPADVVVTTPGGRATATGGFTYYNPPTISTISPATGSPSGGAAIAIIGTTFVANQTTLLIGGRPATSVVVSGTTRIDAVTPIGNGTVDVIVVTPGGQVTVTGGYAYLGMPTIAAITPASGKTSGGDAVIILGTNFVANQTTVIIARNPALGVTVTGGTRIDALTPAGPLGTVDVRVQTPGGQATLPGSFTYFNPVTMISLTVSPASITIQDGGSAQLTATAGYSDGSQRDVTSEATWTTSDQIVAYVVPGGLVRSFTAGSALVTAALSGFTSACAITATAVAGIPLDPSHVAPPASSTGTTPTGSGTAFLYTGTNPIQTGVAPGTIDLLKAGVLRGRVLTTAGDPLPGVTISVHGHPEFGSTATRFDGIFDIAFNAGGNAIIDYAKAGYPSVARQIPTYWGDYFWAPDVVMTPYDPQVTTVDTTSAAQVARGSVMTDGDGSRRVTIFFPQGTQAALQLPSGSTQTLTTFHVRATEYTVGTNGPQAMPAVLPARSAYTYCVELSLDEATAANVTTATFNAPLPVYVDNFLHLPVGTAVPVGSYDRSRGVWVAGANGLVISILGVAGDLALVDTNGDGTPEDLATLTAKGFTTAELQRLAALYHAGTTLWRAVVTHFSVYDLNLAPYIPSGYLPPAGKRQHPVTDNPSQQCGSIIGCESQVLGEHLPLTGSSFGLHYASDRTPGRIDYRQVTIPLTDAVVPDGVLRVELEIVVAGQRIQQTFPPTPNQTVIYNWDGRDGYGRPLQGYQPIDVTVRFIYPAHYLITVDTNTPLFGVQPGEAGMAAPSFIDGRPRAESALSRRYIGNDWQPAVFDARLLGLGGWSLGVHHFYDSVGKVLYLGDGRRRTGAAAMGMVTNLVCPGSRNIAVAGDGTVYSSTPTTLYKATPDGKTVTQLPTKGAGIAVGRDGVYIADPAANRIWRVDSAGNVSAFAGTGVGGFAGDGGPALQAQLNGPNGLTFDSSGNLFVADELNHRLRRVSTAGTITTVAGRGTSGSVADGTLAVNASLDGPNDVAVLPDDTVVFTDSVGVGDPLAGGTGVWRIDVNGVLRRVPTAGIGSANFVTTDSDGSIYVSGLNQIFRVRTDNVIEPFIGGPYVNGGDGPSFVGAGMLQIDTAAYPNQAVVGPDGAVFFGYGRGVWRTSKSLPGASASEIVVPSPEGTELYYFTSAGRHLRTLNAHTGATLYMFGYDAAGHLTSVTDFDGNVTQVVRDGSERLAAVIAPGGQQTAISVDSNGWLASVTNPASESTKLLHSPDGLLVQLTDARQHSKIYSYDSLGLLIKDADPAGGYKTITRGDLAAGFEVNLTTALGRATSYALERLSAGSQRRTTTTPDRLSTVTVGTELIDATTNYPDGTIMAVTYGPDPRWGIASSILQSLSVKTPSGLTFGMSVTDSVSLLNANNPLSLVRETARSTINGHVYTAVFDANNRTTTVTTPAGRVATIAVDSAGRVISQQLGNLSPTLYSYDPAGLLTSISRGSGADARATTIAYDGLRRPQSVTDPLLRVTTFSYDTADRPTFELLPQSRQIGFAYDSNGNITSLVPPGRSAHTFGYDLVSDQLSYTFPRVGTEPNVTSASFNVDRQVTTITHADGDGVTVGYDSAGRISTTSTARGLGVVAYNPTNGQLATASDSGGESLSFLYDGPLPTSAVLTGPVSGSVTYTYDSDFRVRQDHVNGDTVTYVRDADGFLTQVGALTLTRDSSTALLTGTSLGGVTDTSTYDALGQSLLYVAAYGGVALFSEDYGTRDKLGRITLRREVILGEAHVFQYRYDDADRLTDVIVDGASFSHYDYDANGNRTGVSGAGRSPTAAYDVQDRLLSNGAVGYTYTPHGDLATLTQSGVTRSFHYDALGNLVHITQPDGVQIEYVLDAANRRVGKRLNGVLVQGFLWSSQLLIAAELDGSGHVVSRFVYGVGRNSPDYMVRGGATYRIIKDHLGSPRLVVDVASGAVVQRLDYDEFGRVTLDTNAGFQPFGFAGGLYDYQTGLVRFGARDYDAEAGRWTSKDPASFAGGDTNVFVYCANDPVNHVDLDGVDSTWFEDAAETSLTFLAGVGDALLFGQGERFRQWAGNGGVVDRCRGAYSVGEWTGVALSIAVGGEGLPAGLRTLSNGAKGALGEGLSLADNVLSGSKLLGTQVSGRTLGLSTVFDSVWVSTRGSVYYVESKFGAAGLTSAQRAAARVLGDAYQVERWGYPFFGRVGGYLGFAYGAAGVLSGGGVCGCR